MTPAMNTRSKEQDVFMMFTFFQLNYRPKSLTKCTTSKPLLS